MNINFFDTECRLAGKCTNWTRTKRLLEDKVFYNNNVKDSDREALFYLKKKKFWLNVEFQKIELRYFAAKDLDNIRALRLIREAKEWILDASPVDWDGMLLCYKQALEHIPLAYALKQAQDIYKSLL